jgi:hypothetical protein
MKTILLMLSVLFALSARAEQAAECKEAIRSFNAAHAPAEIGVYVHDGQADPVIRAPKGHKQSSAAQAASMGAVRVCIKTGALSGFVYMVPKEGGSGGKRCDIMNVNTMAATCSPNDAKVVFKAVK